MHVPQLFDSSVLQFDSSSVCWAVKTIICIPLNYPEWQEKTQYSEDCLYAVDYYSFLPFCQLTGCLTFKGSDVPKADSVKMEDGDWWSKQIYLLRFDLLCVFCSCFFLWMEAGLSIHWQNIRKQRGNKNNCSGPSVIFIEEENTSTVAPYFYWPCILFPRLDRET